MLLISAQNALNAEVIETVVCNAFYYSILHIFPIVSRVNIWNFM